MSPPSTEHVGSARARTSRDCHATDRGFTLVETLVALTILFVVLVGLSTGLLVARRASEALRAQRQVDRVLEATLESLRAGVLDPRTGPLPVAPFATLDFPVALQLEVEPRETLGLQAITIRATYLSRGAPVERRLTTQIWRPR